MNHVARMQVLGGPKQLIQNVLLVHFLEDVTTFDDVVQVRVYQNGKFRLDQKQDWSILLPIYSNTR